MAKYKVVVTDFEYSNLDPEKSVLDKLDAELIPMQCRTEDEIIEAAKDADAIINQYAPITNKVINSLHNCKVISKYGIGVNTVDLDAATKKGIFVCNVPDYCLDEVSDHAMGLLLASARKIVRLNNVLKAGTWDFKQGAPIFRLRNRVLGLVGFGSIPQKMVPKAKAFGLQVVVYDPFVSKELADSLNVKLVSLEELCRESDFISMHPPLNNHTRGMITKEHFNLMKKEAFIINTSRGPVIDEGALIEALQNGAIAGAGLDVVEEEPISPDNPLFQMDNVILNPHVAWYSVESEKELKIKCAQNVADVLSGRNPAYLVNRIEPGFELQSN